MVPAQVVITPHAGELAALLNRLHHNDADSPLTPQDIQAEPLRYATMAHELTGATVLLKGAITIVVGTDEEKRSRVILSGGPQPG